MMSTLAGVQELEATALGMSMARERPEWEGKLMATMGAGYAVVAKHCVGSIHLIVFAREVLLKDIKDTHSAHVLTGLGAVVANKAGVGVCFDVLETSFLFVTARFSAEGVADRNRDFSRIDEGLAELMCPAVVRTSPSSVANARDGRLLLAGDGGRNGGKHGGAHGLRWSASALFDRVFWLGDFNYCIEGDADVVRKALDVGGGSLQELLGLDQLRAEMAQGACFRGFQEPSVVFRPTYKYDAWSDAYDSSPKTRYDSRTLLDAMPPACRGSLAGPMLAAAHLSRPGRKSQKPRVTFGAKQE